MEVLNLPVAERVEDLVFVKFSDSYRGWRVALLAKQLTGSFEQTFLLCETCNGLLRDANVVVIDGEQELRCATCIPIISDIECMPMLMNQEAVNELIVVCPLKSRDCEWKGPLDTLIGHLKECVHIHALCPNACVAPNGKILTFERRQMTQHIMECHKGKVACVDCGEESEVLGKEKHAVNCEKYQTVCQMCERNVARRDAATHPEIDCPFVKCRYVGYGCKEKVGRTQLEPHEREFFQSHLTLTTFSAKRIQTEQTDRIQQLEKKIGERGYRIQKLEQAVSSIIPTHSFEFKITNLNSKMANRESTQTNPFYVGLYKCQIYFTWGLKSLGCHMAVLMGEWDEYLKWPFRFKLEIKLLNTATNGRHFIYCFETTDYHLRSFPKAFQKPDIPKNVHIGTVDFKLYSSLLKAKYNSEDAINMAFEVVEIVV